MPFTGLSYSNPCEDMYETTAQLPLLTYPLHGLDMQVYKLRDVAPHDRPKCNSSCSQVAGAERHRLTLQPAASR